MSIAIQPSKTSRVQALAAKLPELTPSQLARELGIPIEHVKVALKRNPKARAKSTAS